MALVPFLSALFARGLRRDTLLLLVLHTYYKLTGVVLLVLVSRKLGSAEIGLYFFAISLAESFRLLANFGLDPVLMRRAVATPDEAGGSLACVLGFRLLSSPVYVAAVTAAALALTGANWSVVAVVSVFTLFEDIYASLGIFFVATRRVPLSVAISVGIQTLFLGAVVAGFKVNPSLGTLLGVSLCRTVALVMTALLVTHRFLVPLRVRLDLGFVKTGVPFLLTTFLGQMREKLTTLLLGFLATYAVVGHYQLAYQVLFAAFFVPASVGTAFFPQLSERGFTAANRRIFLRSLWGLAGFGLLGTGAVWLFAPPVARLLYGSLSVEVVPLLRSLAPLLPLRFLEIPMTSALQAVHQERKVLRILGVGTGVSLALGLVLIPASGADGAVRAQVFSSALRVGMLGWCLRGLLRSARSPGATTTQPA
jgi:O-antigen/teichoic acid export membrane protein